MAQLVFEAVPSTGMSLGDSQTVVAVHSMIGQQMVNQQTDPAAPLEENDLFQCGKCKKQFITIEAFVNHKSECNNTNINEVPITSNVCNIPQNAVVVRKIQIPSSLASYSQSVLLTEADLLQLSGAALDPNSSNTATTSNTNLHTLLPPTAAFTPQAVPATVHHVLQPVAVSPETQQHPQLSIINEKLFPRGIILTSQQHSNAIAGVVLNINAVETASVLCASDGENKNDGGAVVTAATEPLASDNNQESSNVSDKEPSTVNIITEFHSSMVKTKKTGTESENEDNQNKKV